MIQRVSNTFCCEINNKFDKSSLDLWFTTLLLIMMHGEWVLERDSVISQGNFGVKTCPKLCFKINNVII